METYVSWIQALLAIASSRSWLRLRSSFFKCTYTLRASVDTPSRRLLLRPRTFRNAHRRYTTGQRRRGDTEENVWMNIGLTCTVLGRPRGMECRRFPSRCNSRTLSSPSNAEGDTVVSSRELSRNSRVTRFPNPRRVGVRIE